MRIMIHSNAPWAASGYGTQTRLMACEFTALGHDVIISAFWGLIGGAIQYECTACDRKHTYTVLPKLVHPYGADSLPIHAQAIGADIVLAFIDPFVLPENLNLPQVPVYLYIPIDHHPLAPAFKTRCSNAWVIAYSKFGQETLREAGIPAAYAPHMVDCGAYYPAKQDQGKFKKWLGFPENAFLIGMVAANKGDRKAYPENMEAVRMLMEAHKNVYLYCHTIQQVDGSRNLEHDLLYQNLVTETRTDHVRLPNPYTYFMGFSDLQMRQAYTAMDVLLAASYGEGFGLPILEAQACGTPVIGTKFSAMIELIKDGAGWLADTSGYHWTQLPSRQARPSVASIYEKLELAYDADRSALVGPARAKALTYDRPKVRDEYWKPLLEKIWQEVKPVVQFPAVSVAEKMI